MTPLKPHALSQATQRYDDALRPAGGARRMGRMLADLSAGVTAAEGAPGIEFVERRSHP
jgi:hypothetical protein